MIKDLVGWFRSRVAESAEGDSGHDIHLAIAALMIEVSRADNDKSDEELTTILGLLSERFEFADDELANLLAFAQEVTDESHDLYSFTSVINEQYEYKEKVRLLRTLWDVAYADGHLDAIEDHTIRRIAGLLHVAHHDFVRQRIEARPKED